MYQTEFALKWNKTEINISVLKALVINLLFSQNVLTLRKESDPFISVSIENFMFLCFLSIYSRKKLSIFWFIKQNKNVINISFVINWFEIFVAIF